MYEGTGDRDSGSSMTPPDQNRSETDSEEEDVDDEIPVWLRRSILICILLSGVFLVVAYVYPYFRSPAQHVPQGPAWKQKANSIIDTALAEKTRKIPELITYLESSEPAVRRNAEWALYYMTGLPWASKPEVCRTWWKAHGTAVMNGEEPTEPRPEPEEFARERQPEEANVERYFQLRSPRRLMLSDRSTAITYVRGFANRNPDRQLRVYPPDVLPYRAYRYGKEIPESVRKKHDISRRRSKIPVHLQYGPSVSMVFVEWFRAASMDQALRKEFVEFSVLGRNPDTLGPGKSMGVQKRFPVQPPPDLFDDGPHALVRLTLDGRDVLAKRAGEKMRIRFDDISHTVHLFRTNPDDVPGYTKRELAELKKRARAHGYKLERAERMQVGAFTDATGVSQEKTSVTSDKSSTASWTTGSGTPGDPRTLAGRTTDIGQDRLMYDQQFEWGRLKEECHPCEKGRQGSHRLNEIRAYAGSNASEKRARSEMNRYSGSRWVLVFKPSTEGESGAAPDSSD